MPHTTHFVELPWILTVYAQIVQSWLMSEVAVVELCRDLTFGSLFADIVVATVLESLSTHTTGCIYARCTYILRGTRILVYATEDGSRLTIYSQRYIY